MIVRNRNIFGILFCALATIWQLSVRLTLAEERNSTTKIAAYFNLSTEPYLNSETKPYPRNFVKPFPKIVASKPYSTAKRRKSTRPERSLTFKVTKKPKLHTKTKRKLTTRKVNRGRHRKKPTKRRHHKKFMKRKTRLTTRKKIESTTTMAKNDIHKNVSHRSEDYYYEEYYIDVASTRPTRLVSPDAASLGKTTLLREISYKMNPQLKILRHLLSELRHASSSGKLNDSQMTDYVFFQYRNFKTTTMKTCRAKEEVTCLVNTYVTYLQSVRKYKELLKAYQKMRERSVEEAAKMVGYKLPQDPEPYLKS